jgi:folate-binding protein YgfZ
MTTSCALLEDRGVLTVSGEESKGFLQGMLTLDMEKILSSQAQAGALLSPQGKILFDLIIYEHEEKYWVETTASQLEALAKRLNFYKLRAKVNIEIKPGWHVLAIWNFDRPPTIGFADPRWRELGYRAFVEKNKLPDLVKQLNAIECTPAGYHTHRIFHAIPEAGKDYALGDAFPHEANFDLLNGVDFAKGCYVGQEVVSRMQHRGIARKRIMPFKLDGAAAQGTAITAGEISLGSLGSSSNTCALGLIRLDRLEEALNACRSIIAGGAKLTPLQPAWANFAIAGAAA